MGPYKQEFSKSVACAGGNGNEDGPGGNPPQGGKEKFYLPRVLLYRDRYCSVCGQTVKEEWKFCRNPKCQASTVPQYPEVPPGWVRCHRCSLSFLHPGQHFCCICRMRTQAGMLWQTQAALLNRHIREMEELFRRGQWQPEVTTTNNTSAGFSGAISVSACSSASSLSSTSAQPKCSKENFSDDEEGDKLVEKMLLDDDDDDCNDVNEKEKKRDGHGKTE